MANKETRVLKSNTFEEFRQKSNEVSLHLGDNEQLDVSLKDKTFDFANVSAGSTLFRGQDDNTKTVSLEIKPEETLDNTGGYIILTGSPSVSGFDAGITLTQSGGYSATIVSSSTSKILVKNSTGTFNTAEDLTAGTDTVSASNVQRIIAEAYPVGVVRVYVNGTEINQNLDAGGFHIANNSSSIILSNNPTVTDFTEGSTIYQGSTLAAATFSGTVLSATSTLLLLKNHTGSFNAGTQIKLDGSSSTIAGANHGDLTTTDIASGHVIELNTPASANDDIKIFSMNLVEAVNELQDDVGITENLTTQAGNIVDAINEIEAVFDASTKEITAGSNAFNVTSGTFTIDSSDDIILDADGSDVVLKDDGTQYGSLTNSSGNIVVKSGSTTMLTGNGADATFANDVTVIQDVDVDRNLNVDGATTLNGTTIDGDLDLNGSVDVSTNATVHGNLDVDGATTLDGTTIDGNLDLNGNVDVSGTSDLHGAVEMNSTLGVDGNFRVGSDKFNVTASSGNTQIDGTLEVDGTAGIDGNLRVGADKFNVTAATGNTQVDGTLNVDGSTTLNGTTVDGDLDLNGNADISTNLTVGGVLDIGTLNAKFTNTNNVKLALNELHDELGNAVITGTGTPADGQTNITNAVNAIDAEIGSTGYIGSTITFALDAAQDYIGTYSNTVTSTISGALDQLHTEVGSLSLNTSATDLTAAVNELHGEINSNDTDIGNLMTLIDGASTVDSSISFTGLAGTNIKSAIQELASEKLDLNTGGTTGALARINAGTDSIQSIVSRLNLTGNVVFQNGGTNANKMTFNTGTTLDLSNATLLLPGSASSVNIFGVSFLKVDGDVTTPMGFSVDRDHVTQTDTNPVSLQWHENYTDGTTASNPARGWQLVGLNDSGVTNTADVVTFYNAKELIDDTDGSGINVVWDAQNQNFDLDAEDFTITLGTGPISGSVSINNLQDATFNTTLDNNSVTLGTHTIGRYVISVAGTSNEIEVSSSPSSHTDDGATYTIGLPNSVDIVDLDVTGTTQSSSSTTGALTVVGGAGIAKNLYVGGDLFVQGNQTILNTTTLEVEDTLVLAGNGLSSEPSSGGFGLEVGPITSPSGVASGVTGAHSIVYNYGTDQWEADGSLILSEATLGSPDVAAGAGSNFELGLSKRLHFNAGTGIGVVAASSGNDIDITISNTLDGYSGWFLYEDGNNRNNVGDDSIVDFRSGTVMDIAYDNATSPNRKRLTFNHANVGLSTATATDNGDYIQSINVSAQGHVTGITSGNFNDDYDNYGSWTFKEGNGSETGTIGSGQELHFEQGTGIEVEKTADRQLTITNTDKGSDQYIYKNVATDDGTATANTNNDTLTIAGGSALATERSGDTVTINHTSVGAGSVDNTGNTFIQDLTIDANGHITGVESGTVTVGNGTISIEAGDVLSLGATQDGIFTTNQGGDETITINHDDVTRTDTTSTQNDGYGSTFTAVDSVTSTAEGHITAINLKTVTMPSEQTIPTPGNGTITFAGGTALHIDETDKTISMNQNTGQTITIDHDDIGTGEATGNQLTMGFGSAVDLVTQVVVNAQGHVTSWGRRSIKWPSTPTTITGNAGSATVLATARNFSITGDITASAVSFDGGAAVALNASIDNNVVGNAQLVNMAANTIKGRKDSAGDPQDLSAADVRGILGIEAGATADQTAAEIRSLVESATDSNVFTDADHSKLNGIESSAHNHSIYGYNDGTSGFVMSNGLGGSNHIYIIGGSGISVAQASNYNGTGDHGLRINCDVVNTDRYVNSASFNTSNGILTLTRAGSDSSTITVDLDGRFTDNGYADTMNQHVRTTDTVLFGTVRSSNDVVAYYSSDKRLKDNIKPIENSLDKVNKLTGYEFDWNDKQDIYEGHDIGVIAQEVEEVAPEIVETRESGYKAIKYEKLTALLINAVKELTEENKQIRLELENLKSINR